MLFGTDVSPILLLSLSRVSFIMGLNCGIPPQMMSKYVAILIHLEIVSKKCYFQVIFTVKIIIHQRVCLVNITDSHPFAVSKK